MEEPVGLRTKFNLLLFIVALAGFGLFALAANPLVNAIAREEAAKFPNHDGERNGRPQIYVRADCADSAPAYRAAILSAVRLGLCRQAQFRRNPLEISRLRLSRSCA